MLVMEAGKQLLSQLENQIANCMKCGNCMEVCPIYKELGKESGVARGKLAVIEAVNQGYLELNDSFANLMNLCTSCKACSAKCPCGVKPDEIILKARAAVVKQQGLPILKKASFAFLKKRHLFNMGMKFAGIFGGIAMKKIPGKVAAVLRFVNQERSKRVIAPVAKKSLRNCNPEVIKVSGNAKKRVGYFTGCMANYIYTDIGQAVIDVLIANDMEVVLPKNQHCCGTPVYTSGDIDAARILAQHNIEVFESYQLDYIVTSCGSCTESWKEEYGKLFQEDAEMCKRIKKLADKTYEISQFLVDIIPLDTTKLGAVNKIVTMHDPCHMARGIHVTDQPRNILTVIPDLKLVEMKEPARCCGAGGSFCMVYYELSQRINDRKIKDINSTGADIVATGCGSCRMHITDGIVRNHMQQNVVHTIQLLDLAYKNGLMK